MSKVRNTSSGENNDDRQEEDDTICSDNDGIQSSIPSANSDNDETQSSVPSANSDNDETQSSPPSATYMSSSDKQMEGSTGKENDDSDIVDIEKLEMLCYVLDIKFGSKLDEIDVIPKKLTPEAVARVRKSVEELEITRERRFKQFQKRCQELMAIWTDNHVTVSKGINLVVVYAVANAKSAGEITGENFLSNNFIKKVGDEIFRLESLIKKKIANKYLKRKNKVKELLSNAHLVATDVGFNHDEPVTNLQAASKEMKQVIKDLKKKFRERKELLIIVDSVKVAVNNLWPLHITEDFLEKAKKQVQKMKAQSEDTDITYDGAGISELLENFLTVAITLHDEAFENQVENSLEISKTRSGSRFKSESPHTRADYVPEQVQTDNTATDVVADWLKADRRRMLSVSYHVQNLENAIKCCTEGFGMKVFRRIGGIGDAYTEVFLGFGSERTNFALRLIQTHIGGSEHGSGHVTVSVNNVRKVIGKIKSLPGYGAMHEPISFREGSYTIAYTHDTNGHLFELVESRTMSDMVCGMMLYITDLDKSINFYVNVLGMRLLSRKRSSCTLGYGEGDDKAAFLELRVNAESLKGCPYTKIFIATDDIVTTTINTAAACVDFGGVVPEQARTIATNKTISVLDPDGWKIVLAQRDATGACPDREDGPAT